MTMEELLNLSDEAVISSLPSEGYLEGGFSEGTNSMSHVTAEHRVSGQVTLRRALLPCAVLQGTEDSCAM